MKHLWEIEHPYYFYSTNLGEGEVDVKYDSWDDFVSVSEYNCKLGTGYPEITQWKDDFYTADLDYNLLVRWDWYLASEGSSLECDTLRLNYVLQRKLEIVMVEIKVVKSDEPKVIEFLTKHWEHNKELWQPFV